MGEPGRAGARFRRWVICCRADQGGFVAMRGYLVLVFASPLFALGADGSAVDRSRLPDLAAGWTIQLEAESPIIRCPSAVVAAPDGTVYLGQDALDPPGQATTRAGARDCSPRRRRPRARRRCGSPARSFRVTYSFACSLLLQRLVAHYRSAEENRHATFCCTFSEGRGRCAASAWSTDFSRASFRTSASRSARR